MRFLESQEGATIFACARNMHCCGQGLTCSGQSSQECLSFFYLHVSSIKKYSHFSLDLDRSYDIPGLAECCGI
jgi:hypothetical protein